MIIPALLREVVPDAIFAGPIGIDKRATDLFLQQIKALDHRRRQDDHREQAMPGGRS